MTWQCKAMESVNPEHTHKCIYKYISLWIYSLDIPDWESGQCIFFISLTKNYFGDNVSYIPGIHQVAKDDLEFLVLLPAFPQLISTENQHRDSHLLSPLEPLRWPPNKCTQRFPDRDSSPVCLEQGERIYWKNRLTKFHETISMSLLSASRMKSPVWKLCFKKRRKITSAHRWSHENNL